MSADRVDTPPPAPDTVRGGADVNLAVPDGVPVGDEGTPAADARARERKESDGLTSRLKHGAMVLAATVNFGAADVAHSTAPLIDVMSVRAAQAVGTTEDVIDQAGTIRDEAGNIFRYSSGGDHGDLSAAGNGAETAEHAVTEVSTDEPVTDAPQDPAAPGEPGSPAKEIETELWIRGEKEKEQLEEAQAAKEVRQAFGTATTMADQAARRRGR